MRTLKTLFYILLFNTGLLSATFFLGISDNVRSSGVSGKVQIEGGTPEGTRVIFTIGNDVPIFGHSAKDSTYIEEYLSDNGTFYRAITHHTSGVPLHIWIQREGYPLIHQERTLVFEKNDIDFGQIIIPKKLRNDQLTPVHFYDDPPCVKGNPVVVALPRNIKVLKKFSSKRCSSDGMVHCGAKVEFADDAGALTATEDTPALDRKALASVELSF